MEKRRRDRRAFTLMEVMLAMFILSVMAMLFAAVLPTATRSSRSSADYSQASTLVMHKLNQVQEAGYDKMNGPGLGQSDKDVVDGSPTTPTASDNADGDQTATFEFTTTDNLWQYFASGRSAANTSVASTAANRPRGYLTIEPYMPSSRTSGGATTYDLIRVTAKVQWTNSRGLTQSFSATTLVPRTPIQ